MYSRYPYIFIDISDIFIHLKIFKRVTGIQRCIIKITNEICNIYPIKKIKIVIINHKTQTFDIVQITSALELMNKIENEEIQNYNFDDILCNLPYEKFNKEDFYDNGYFLSLGIAWAFDDYFLAVKKFKNLKFNFVSMIYDIIPIDSPQFVNFSNEKFEIYFRNILIYSDLILCNSSYVEQSIVNFAIDNNLSNPPKIIKINLAKDKLFPNKETPINLEQFKSLKYILLVGSLNYRKNQILLIKIWEKLYRELKENTPTLLLVGMFVGYGNKHILQTLRNNNFLNGKIKIFSDLSDQELDYLYKNCYFTVFPSFYEGWGLPVGESLAYGKVCLSSNSTSLTEVGEELSVYFSPQNFNDCYTKIFKYINNKKILSKQENLIKRNFKRRTWRNVSQEIIEVLKNNFFSIEKLKICINPGEYIFSRIPTIKNIDLNSINKFLNSEYVPEKLNWTNYLYSEIIINSLVYQVEEWGRWSKYDQCTIEFSISHQFYLYYIFFILRIPAQYKGCNLQICNANNSVKNIVLKDTNFILKLNIKDFLYSDLITIKFKLFTEKPVVINGQEIGVGLERMIFTNNNINFKYPVYI